MLEREACEADSGGEGRFAGDLTGAGIAVAVAAAAAAQAVPAAGGFR